MVQDKNLMFFSHKKVKKVMSKVVVLGDIEQKLFFLDKHVGQHLRSVLVENSRIIFEKLNRTLHLIFLYFLSNFHVVINKVANP